MSDRLASATVAVLGFGHQGEAQALNLRDSGVAVRVGAREGGGAARARAQDFEVLGLADAARGAHGDRARSVAGLRPRLQPGLLRPRLPGARRRRPGLSDRPRARAARGVHTRRAASGIRRRPSRP
ncbi:MAG: hypothetical protein E6K72_05660 [Candidatus Eisenbacteria bacterium]|uniref:KARI N-terminal Rossmann domain-containing protein n=1 Tax=Eiseniibacteriota bacterium TaxID=2212470 RepID=A0A538SXC8_UNCEI|nr:MAG: hypothetical protein E6K72_05660 [Candidatus Eisenbacteria bacterium]